MTTSLAVRVVQHSQCRREILWTTLPADISRKTLLMFISPKTRGKK
jgi:hypothetical protein